MPLIGLYQVAAFAQGAVAIHSMWSAIICFTKALQCLISMCFHLDTEYTHGSLCLAGLDNPRGRFSLAKMWASQLAVLGSSSVLNVYASYG